MFIKKIEIEGFKSYAQKQYVGDFDKEFNAITGLNGSGKSNILDSICFVLGITNLTHIRANCLTDLVYKQGQAGVTKACVTITFDNRGRNGEKRCPPGFHNMDFVVVRRQVVISTSAAKSSQYFINGQAQPNGKVIDLFRSIGLNVNNPHFLIMQGRITKVLNMKPAEILGMIEEAAGTKMYDTKRHSAVTMIEKKEKRVEDIKKLMETDILPVVKRMKDDREEHLKYQKMERENTFRKRKYAAYNYTASIESEKRCIEEADACSSKNERFKDEIVENDKLLEEVVVERAEKEKQKGDDHREGKSRIDKEVKAAREQLTAAESAVEDVKASLEEAALELKNISQEKVKDEADLAKKEQELDAMKGDVGDEEQAGLDLMEQITMARKRVEALEQGMTTDDQGQLVTLESQMTEARTRLTELTSEVKRREARRKDLNKKLTEKAAELEKYEKGNKVATEWKKRKTAELQKIIDELQSLDFSEQEFNECEQHYLKLKTEIELIGEATNEKEKLCIQRYEPSWRLPYDGFDVNLVLGSVVRYFRLRAVEDVPALEQVVSAYANALIVKTQQASKEMLKRNVFARRTNLYPIDAMHQNTPPDHSRRVAAAKKIENGEMIECALDLISYHPQFSVVMKMIFENVMVCEKKGTAHKICYDVAKMRTITRDGGNDYRPNGIISGGSQTRSSTFDLKAIDEYFRTTDQYKDKEGELAECSKKLSAMKQRQERFLELKDRKEQIESELLSHAEKMKFSDGMTCKTEIDEINKELEEHDAFIASKADEMKELQKKLSEFEQRKKSDKAFQEKEKAEARKKLKELQQKQKELKGAFEKARNVLSTLRCCIDNLNSAIDEAAQKKGELTKRIQELNHQKDVAEQVHDKAKDVALAAAKKSEDFHVKMRAKDAELSQLTARIEKIKKEQQLREAAIEANDADRKRKLSDAHGHKERAKKIKKENTWIEAEKEHFGQSGTDYDFDGYDANAEGATIAKIEEVMKEMDGRLNVADVDLLAPSEERVIAVQKKQVQLESDKGHLISTIETLDMKKNEEILRAYEHVNKDFGSIFSTLLPGTDAKLEPPRGKTALDGLEIKVAFNGKWKESLGELSGGQRSLVALSLVLAMLKFRPAPIYILDEVDAALDLSHTQNIGAMIKNHFNKSQFIVVSLKEGMFNHASVLFKTRFVDGTSQVTRIDNTAASNR